MSAKRKASIPKPVAATNGPVLYVGHQEKFSPTEADAPDDSHFGGRNGDLRLSAEREMSATVADEAAAAALWNYHAALKKATPPSREQTSPLMGADRASLGHDSGSVHDETSSSGNKDDDDEDDEECDEKMDPQKYDPERLKAFNMFVRLFVDENLDRIVPISKQPKEKIQAIIDSCTRQFPEFADRARKRIRTYLKSCRRNKRTRDSNGTWEAARPTPAHLTSVQAEQILASACENESQNAKRMRLGLEPISQPMPIIPGATPVESLARPVMLDHFTAQSTTPSIASMIGVSTGSAVSLNPGLNMSVGSSVTITPSSERESKIHHSISNLTNNNHMINNNNTTNCSGGFHFSNSLSSRKDVPAVEIIPTQMKSNSTIAVASTTNSIVSNNNGSLTVNGSSPTSSSSSTPTTLYRPNFTQAFQRSPDTSSPQTMGPTDLSMKSSSVKPLLSHKLSSTEMVAVRQLITGYRESAAFLLRSADELEQLLINQP